MRRTAAVVLGGLFLFRLVLAGAYRAPREVHWWLAVGAFLLILGLGVTGNILPWDQRGYWAMVVETTIAGGTPVLGPILKKLIIGGSEFGNQTITRFYGLHVAVMPGLLFAIGWAYAVLFGKHGYDGPAESDRTEAYWPRQALYDLSLAAGVLGVLSILTLMTHGYPLDAPADPASDDYPARPEWYFLPLNVLLHAFEGREFIATMIIPGAIMAGLFLLPMVDKVLPGRMGRVASGSFLATVGGTAAILIGIGIYRDSQSPAFQSARAKADRSASRASLLANRDGVPPDGSSYVLGLDPLHRGGEIFARKCLGCHSMGMVTSEPASAPDLHAFGSYDWIRGLLEKPDSPSYFGHAPQCDGMSTWKEQSKLDAKGLDEVASYVASFATIPPEMTPQEWQADPTVKAHPGRLAYQRECAQCHTMGDPSALGKMMQPAPDLFAWGSDRWAARMIREPDATKHYGYLGADQVMPAFGGQLTSRDVDTLVRFLKGNFRGSTWGVGKTAGLAESVTQTSR